MVCVFRRGQRGSPQPDGAAGRVVFPAGVSGSHAGGCAGLVAGVAEVRAAGDRPALHRRPVRRPALPLGAELTVSGCLERLLQVKTWTIGLFQSCDFRHVYWNRDTLYGQKY